MAKASPLFSDFSGGEFGPKVYGRLDAEQYKRGLETLQNYFPELQGPADRRCGSHHVAAAKGATGVVRLIPYVYSETEAYMVELGRLEGAGTGYLRFYKNNGTQITSAGTPVEVSTAYDIDNIPKLQWAQIDQYLWIVGPNTVDSSVYYKSFQPLRLLRGSDDVTWSFTGPSFVDGPYFPINSTATTLFASAETGSVTVTASTGIFTEWDATNGRHIRMLNGSNWAYLVVTAYTSATVVTATVVSGTAPTSPNTSWRLGMKGFAQTIAVHEDRLVLGKWPDYPLRVDLSETGDYLSFSPSELAGGTVVDSNAISFTLNAKRSGELKWLASDEKGLLAGTTAGEWVVRPSSNAEALTPSNVNAKPTTFWGSALIQPIQVGKSLIFAQQSKRKLREMGYFFDIDGFRAPELTQISDHILGEGITEMSYQKEPSSRAHLVREDGQLITVAYERDLDSIRLGFARQVLGGYSDKNTSPLTPAEVESCGVILSSDNAHEQIWLVVKRVVNGSTVRYIEYIGQPFDASVAQEDGFFVDSGITYDSPKTITGATAANPVVITSNAHGFSNGDEVVITEVKGMTQLNGNRYTIANVAANTFELSGVNGTAFTAYTSGGEARKCVSTVTGLTHLVGETVSICADGGDQGTQTVSATGTVTLSPTAAVVHVGLPYNSDFKLLKLEAGATDGTALGKTRRVHRIALYLHRSLGLKYGFDGFDDLTEIEFREDDDPLSQATPLFSGIKVLETECDYNMSSQLCLRQDKPLPSMILAVALHEVTQER